MVLLLLITCGGYFGVFLLVQRRAGQQVENRLDHQSSRIKVDMVLKTPVLLPYQSDRQMLRRSGENLVVGGQHFTAILSKVIHDTLYTYYFRDAYTNRVYGSLDQLIQLTEGQPLSSGGNIHLRDNLLREYLPLNIAADLPDPAFSGVPWHSFASTLPADPQIRMETPPPQSLV